MRGAACGDERAGAGKRHWEDKLATADAVATPRRWFHRFLSGHPGVGKSTEFSRLEQRLTGEFEVVYLNAQTELNPALFHSLDLILVLMKAATDRAKERIGKKKVPSQAAESMLEAMEWLGETKETKRIRSAIDVSGKGRHRPRALVTDRQGVWFFCPGAR
jgi:hypothetical protein